MARKDRVPNPPKRPVQAPQRRSTPTTAADAERQKRLLYMIAGSGIVALVVVLGFLFLGGGGDKSEAAVLEDAGCTLKTYPALGAQHLDTLVAKPKWNSSPPSSGPHYVSPAVWGSYDEPVPLIQSTHNLEHGAIVIHYGSGVPAAEIEKIRNWYVDDPNGLVVAPLPSLGKSIVLTAWTTGDGVDDSETGRGYLATCPTFDEEAFSAFKDEHRGKGPERFPVESLVPGS